MEFAEKLRSWYRVNKRDLPWRHTKDPYTIWLSEIILQQTRVEQGLPYFYKFVEHFPTVNDFAHATEEEILRAWQGLGYYSRARNMHKAAKQVLHHFNGVFPSNYNDLITLQGVGDYSAAAISSFARNEQQAVLDGNVFRVLSRYFGISTPINSSAGKKEFRKLAQELIPADYPGMYNHAIMDFGATVCKPKAPLCLECIFNSSCAAYSNQTVHTLPVKNKGNKSRDRYFHYFLVENERGVLMCKRGEGDVWANMYEFPLLESDTIMEVVDLLNDKFYQKYFDGCELELIQDVKKHVLSHQNIYAVFYRIKGDISKNEKNPNWIYFLSENLDKLAKHKLIFSFINKNFID